VVLTDRRLIKELIDKRSSIYSDRPPNYVSNHIITEGDHLLVMNHGEKWRLFRKLVHSQFMESKCESDHVSLQEAEAVQMLRDFCLEPSRHMLHPGRFSNSISMALGWSTNPFLQ
jgi:cytochrome P450